MKKFLVSVVGVMLSLFAFSQNFPFPMNENGYKYPYGIVPTNVSNDKIQSKFEAWERAMYDESGNMARIKYDDGTSTVSEGIAYGMLIYVYMANETNTQCQDHFDKLYTYYKNWSDSKGLMNWKITGFSSIASGGSGGATDADLDVGLALCLAAKQWESSSKYVYANEAETILKNIYNYETWSTNGYRFFKPGDSWNDNGNPCYFTQASVGVFAQAQEDLGFTTTKDWQKVYEDGHVYLEKSQRLGVWPNWTNWNSTYDPQKRPWISAGTDEAKDEVTFGWDACRVPWRVGWDYVWYGNESSKKMLNKTIEMLKAKNWYNNANIGYLAGLDGSDYSSLNIPSKQGYSSGNVAWTGSVACALMIDSEHQSSLDTYNSSINSKTGQAYYAQTLQVLYMLTLSGNAANFYDCDGGSSVIANPVVSAAETDGSKVTLTCSKKMSSSTNYSGFTIYKGGVAQSNVISSMAVSGKTITLNLNNNITIEPGDMLAISYNGTNLQSEEGGVLGNVVKMTVKNNVPGGNTIIADCETDKCLLGGPWYNYDDKNSNASSTISPSNASDMIVSGGKNGSAVKVTYTLNKGSYQYDPFIGFGFNLYEGTDEDKKIYKTLDCTGATGISFYHKGTAVTFMVKIPGTGGNYHGYNIDAHNDWTPVTITWDKLEQEQYWGTAIDFSEKDIYGLQWQVKGSTGTSGDIWIDDVTLLGKTINIDLDHSNLEATLATANALYNEATVETYPQSAITTFYNAIDAAATTNMTAKSQSELDNANTTLLSAISTFKAAAYADKSPLSKAIATATVLSNNSPIGTNNGDYPQSAKNDLDAAIASAQTVYNKVGLTETEMNSAIDALNTAINTFKASVIVIIDKSELKDLIDVATSILNTTEVGTQVGQYSASKRTSLENALKNAQSVYDDASATQSVVNIRISSLKAAYNAYMSSKVTSTAVDDVEFALAIYPNPCTDVLSIESSNTIEKVNIVGMNGVRFSTVVENTSGQIEVSRLAKGVYSLQIFFEDGTVKVMSFMKK